MEMTSRMKLRIDTLSDINEFVALATSCPADMILKVVDNYGMCVNARSMLGMMYATEFKHMWLESNSDKIHTIFERFRRD